MWKSPPTREVGPSGGDPEAELIPKREEEENSLESDSEKATELEMNQQSDEESRTEDSEVEAPLGSAHVRNWSPWYARCPRWGENWGRMHANDETFEWPEGTRIVEGRMFLGHKTCIATPLQKEWIRAVHEV